MMTSQLPPALAGVFARALPGRRVVTTAIVKLLIAVPVPSEWSDSGVVGQLVVSHDAALDTCFFQVRVHFHCFPVSTADLAMCLRRSMT